MTYARALSLFKQNIPHATFRPQPSSDWAGLESLSAEIAVYYQLLGPVDVEVPNFENTILLPPLKDLWVYQEPTQLDITTGERDETWKDGYFYSN